MKNYTLFSHGSAPIEMVKEEGYEFPSPPLCRVPANVSVVFYIPPGTIFDAVCGAMLYTRLRNHTSLTSKAETERVVQGVRADMVFEAKEIDYREKKRDQIFWVGEKIFKEYPKLCNANKNADSLYNYKLKGRKPTDHAILNKVTFGLCEIGYHGATVQAIDPGGATTLQAMLDAASRHAGAEEAIVHCIFCRVEQFDDARAESYAHPSRKTTTLMHVHIFDHETPKKDDTSVIPRTV